MSYLCEMKRYGKIEDEKEKIEIILLRGLGCTWGKCTFCDYCKDFTSDINSNYKLNKKVIDCISGEFKKLQVICSGSFAELDLFTINYLKKKCEKLNIKTIIFEGHYQHRNLIPLFRDIFSKSNLEFIVGVETFDIDYREKVMKKGMGKVHPEEISKYFNRINLMFGIKGQTIEQLKIDLDLACKYFDKISLNIFTPNSTEAQRDDKVVEEFYNSPLFKKVIDNNKIRLLDDLNRDKTDSFDLVGEALSNIDNIKCVN